MNKTLFQFAVLAGIFFLLWQGLSRVDFMKHLHLAGISRKTENKIGDLVIEGLRKSNKIIDDDSTQQVLDKVKKRLCAGNGIDPGEIHLYLVQSDQVNAFAIPGHNIIVYTGLIEKCDSVTELCGVLSHEMGHIQLNHVMKRLVNELGIAVLASVATNGNSQIAGEILKRLSSSAFARKQESEADAIGVKYLQTAHINPKGFADIMSKLAELQAGTPDVMEWISSHPDSKKRVVTILGLIDNNPHNYTPVLDDEEWNVLKAAATENP